MEFDPKFSESVPFVWDTHAFLQEAAPSCPYNASFFKMLPRSGRGQLKLFFSELDFLTRHANDDDVVFYAGACPGNHLYSLTQFFPKVTFHLYDPRPGFDQRLHELDNVSVNVEPFDSNRVPQSEHGKYILLSDIRNTSYNSRASAAERHIFEQMVLDDNDNQNRWLIDTNPKAAQLKMRPLYNLPSSDSLKFMHFPGMIQFQPWAKPGSSETRLELVGPFDEKSLVQMPHRGYEEALMYHNITTRHIKMFTETIPGSYDLLNNWGYDAAFSVEALIRYLTSRGVSNVTEREILPLISHIISSIDQGDVDEE